ncbi:Serpentine Receptor, class D (Delta) [Caenorhabditis elegans]|uniref:Serpentine Receptor, class D (Delta) n=1 Tax=Caenorhabditis elegans TaxID=6239 RepID=Q19419_CAEEL|nr:Serpentine Receptor, class D (Delta) [Caenorhabditis elegans]CAA95790.1 Serpentine Receptor, class D (Delta) [Caenorhabditis elegans]|eukprot:NP_492061.1 Serpentine Receptor, class D (delta) [Caenorhabditis elegans]
MDLFGSSSNRFVPIINIYFHFYLVSGLFFQCILMILIIRKSPNSLNDLKLFLYNTAFCQIANILSAYFIQYRALPNTTTLAVLANGLCRKFGPEVCFGTYHVYLGISSSVALSISTTVMFRYSLIKNWRLSRTSLRGLIICGHIAPFIATAIPFTTQWDFDVVRAQSVKEHSTYDLSIYAPFSGFSDTRSFQFLFVTAAIAIGAYFVPLMSVFVIRKIMIVTKAHSKMSENTKRHTRMLMKGLACQVLLPLISYFPIITLYLVTQMTAEEFLITEHLLNIMTCFPALVDPFISFYFIVPYRVALLKLVKKKVDSTIDVTTYIPPPVSFRHSSTIHG